MKLISIPHKWVVNYLYLFIFLVPWNFFKGQIGVLTALLILLWLITFQQNGYWTRLKTIFKSKPTILFFLFIVYTYSSYFWSTNTEVYNSSQMFFKYYWVIVPLFFSILNHEEALKGIKIFVLSFGVYALFSISIYAGLLSIGASTVDNPQGTVSYTISTPYMALGVLMSYIFAFNETNLIQKRLYYGIALISLIGLFINYGRAAQIGFVLTASILLITYFRRNLNFKLLLIFVLALGAGVFVLNSVGKLDRFKVGFQQLTKYQEIENLEGSWGCRLYLIHASKEIIHNEPIFGAGAGDNIDQLIEWTKKHPNLQTDWNRTFHNQHLEFITKYGLIGYFLLISAVVVLLYQLKDLPLAFGSALTFFTFTAFDGIADIIILMKPYNNIFAMMFVLFAVIAYEKQIGMTPKDERLC